MTNLKLKSFFDLNPITIGFDELFEKFNKQTSIFEYNTQYPPYNILKINENKYQIEFAIAGFNKEEIFISVKENQLTISGNKKEESNENFLYKGISSRSFKKIFQLHESVEINEASLDNGILKIYITKLVPIEKQEKKIEIKSSNESKLLLQE